jgi:nucleoside transporter
MTLFSIPARLSVMMFLQFFTWGAWFATLGQCLGENGLKGHISAAYGSAPIAAIISPLFLGLIADRFFPSQIVMGSLMLIGGGLLGGASTVAETGNGSLMVWLILGHLLCFMPTLGLGNSIVFSNVSDPNTFPRIRVWGTIGWIVAGLVVGFQGWSSSFNIFRLAAITSIVLGFYSLTLPNSPPPAKGKPINLRTLLMLDAFGMLAELPFLVFIACSTLICIPLAYYYGYTSNLLGQVGFEQPAAVMTLGQMSEIFFMILIPFFFRHLGVKAMILVGMAAWTLRYLLFAFGAPSLSVSMILMAVVLHGICYDFFFVTGFMYTDSKANSDTRGQAQCMLVFFTQGVGMFFGYWIAGDRFTSTVTNYDQLNAAIQADRPASTVGFVESFQRMFAVNLPDSLDSQLLADTMQQWKEFWLLPAMMAGGIFVVFLLLFRDSSGSAVSEIGDES